MWASETERLVNELIGKLMDAKAIAGKLQLQAKLDLDPQSGQFFAQTRVACEAIVSAINRWTESIAGDDGDRESGPVGPRPSSRP